MSNTKADSWGAHAGMFNVLGAGKSSEGVDLSKLQFGVAANVMYAWREAQRLLDLERQAIDGPLHVVDFGCGGGGFAQQCDSLGDSAVGIDSSSAMIAKANAENRMGAVYFLTGSEQALRYFPRRDAIVANLVTNYLPSLDELANLAAASLRPGGLLVLANLNPEYVRECLRQGVIYSEPDPRDNPRYAKLNFAGGAQQITLWERADFERAFDSAGLTLEQQSSPPLSADFLQRFESQIPDKYPRDLPRYTVYSFRRAPAH